LRPVDQDNILLGKFSGLAAAVSISHSSVHGPETAGKKKKKKKTIKRLGELREPTFCAYEEVFEIEAQLFRADVGDSRIASCGKLDLKAPRICRRRSYAPRFRPLP